MKNCIELDAVDKWIDLGLFRLGQSYLSLRGQDDEETSFFCLAPISMTIESKDFLQRNPGVSFSSRITLFMKNLHRAQSSFLTYFVMRAYHVMLFCGVHTSSLARKGIRIFMTIESKDLIKIM